jgi:hypothetical protein
MKGADVRSLLDDLSDSHAGFHVHPGWTPEVAVNFGLNQPALDALVDLVVEGHATLETGVGYSTVLFAARGAHHTVVSPFVVEHERVRSWCADRTVDVSQVRFVAARSQDALPGLEPTPLDLVLIDGDHAFPAPFIDFYYAAERLVPGGVLVVDDTHVRACRVLVDFLIADSERWKVHAALPTTVFFERLEGPLIPERGWMGQPWGATPLRLGPRLSGWDRVRQSVRLRTRLRTLVGRDRAV